MTFWPALWIAAPELIRPSLPPKMHFITPPKEGCYEFLRHARRPERPGEPEPQQAHGLPSMGLRNAGTPECMSFGNLNPSRLGLKTQGLADGSVEGPLRRV